MVNKTAKWRLKQIRKPSQLKRLQVLFVYGKYFISPTQYRIGWIQVITYFYRK